MFRSPRTRQEKFCNRQLETVLRLEPELGQVRFRRRCLRDGWDDIKACGNRIRSWKRHRRTQHRTEVYS